MIPSAYKSPSKPPREPDREPLQLPGPIQRMKVHRAMNRKGQYLHAITPDIPCLHPMSPCSGVREPLPCILIPRP